MDEAQKVTKVLVKEIAKVVIKATVTDKGMVLKDKGIIMVQEIVLELVEVQAMVLHQEMKIMGQEELSLVGQRQHLIIKLRIMNKYSHHRILRERDILLKYMMKVMLKVEKK